MTEEQTETNDTESEDALPSSVELNGQTFQLELPKSLAIRHEVTYAVAVAEQRAFACALGLMVRRIRGKLRPYDGKPLEYGGLTLEFLLEQGVPYLSIMNAGRIAWAVMSKGCLPGQAVEKTTAFFDQTKDASTG